MFLPKTALVTFQPACNPASEPSTAYLDKFSQLFVRIGATAMNQGHTAIEPAFRKPFAGPGVMKLTGHSEIAGTIAYSVRRCTVTIPMQGGSSQTIAAKYLTAFKRVESDWGIVYDMQNTDQAPPK